MVKAPGDARTRRRPVGLWILLGLGSVLGISSTLAVRYETSARVLRRLEARFPLVSPERRLDQFLVASQRGDIEGMLELADPAEVARLGLTTGKLAAMLQDATGAPGPLQLVRPRPELLNETQRRYNRWVNVEVSSRSGAVLPDGRVRAILQAYNTDAGWKIGIGNFLYAVQVSRLGMDGRKPRFAALCQKHGLKPELFWPDDARWEKLSATAAATPAR